MRRTARPWPVAFTVEGLNIERFVRQAGEARITLTDMRRTGPRRLTALVQEDFMPALQELALRGGWTLTMGSRCGAGCVVEWLRRRWLLAAAVLCAGAALSAASQVVWWVEIVDGGAYAADIQQALVELGVEVPMLRSQVDVGQLRDALEWRYPRIAWFECGWRGTTLVVRPIEGTLPRTDGDIDGPCDVVATRDAVVYSVVTRAGTPQVTAGEIVRAGQVLIKGEERTSNGAVRQVAARGSVTGRVWEGASVRMSAVESVTTYTGNEQTVWTIRTPWFDLWQMADCPFDHYDISVSEQPVGEMFIPMVLYVENRMEADITVQTRDIDAVKADASAAALRKLHEKLSVEESLIDIWGNCSMIDAENVLSLAIGELLVEIGTQRSAPGMAAPGE